MALLDKISFVLTDLKKKVDRVELIYTFVTD